MSISVEDVIDMQRIHTIGERQIFFFSCALCFFLSSPPSLSFPLCHSFNRKREIKSSYVLIIIKASAMLIDKADKSHTATAMQPPCTTQAANLDKNVT